MFHYIRVYDRVAQGLKGAVSYFQNTMVAVIFAALIYFILEIYLDDTIVHDEGKGFAQFLINLGKKNQTNENPPTRRKPR